VHCGQAVLGSTKTSVIAAIAGPRTALAKECSASAALIAKKLGHKAIARALTPIAAIAAAAAIRLLRIASTSAPAGTWLAILAMVPVLSAAPIAPWVHPALVR
jgi:hypothetical protein